VSAGEGRTQLSERLHLKHALGQVDSNFRNLHDGRPLRLEWLISASTLAHHCRIGWGVHSMNKKGKCNIQPNSTKTSGDVVFSLFSLRFDENFIRQAKLNHLSEIHVGSVVGHARSLLHVVRYDSNGVLAL